MKKFLSLLFSLLWFASSSVVAIPPGVTYETASYLCSLNPVISWDLTPGTVSTLAQSGPNYQCLTGNSLNRPHWFRFYVASGGNIDLKVQANLNTDLDHIVWGPFQDAFVPIGSLGTPIACSNSIILTDNIVIPGQPAGGYYIIMVANKQGLLGTNNTFSFIPNPGHTAVFGSALSVTVPPTQLSLRTCDNPVQITLNPTSGVSDLVFSGNGVNASGSFNPAAAGVGTHTISVSGRPFGCFQIVTTSVVFTVSPSPSTTTISTSPSNGISSTVPSVTLTATANPPGLYSYSWAVPSTASNPGNVASFGTSVPGLYTVTSTPDPISRPACSSSTASVFIYGSPNITRTGPDTICWNRNPGISRTSLPVIPGSVTVSGYQWQIRNIGPGAFDPLPGATNPLDIGFITRSGVLEARLKVILSNGDSLFSNVVTFVVLPPLERSRMQILPVGTPTTICYNGSVTLQITPTTGGGGMFLYDWERNTGSAWALLAPRTTLLQRTFSNLTQSGWYRVKATDTSAFACGSVISDSIYITVQGPVTAGTISVNSDTICIFSPLVISSTAVGTGTGTLVYLWQSSTDQVNWVPIPNSNSVTLNVPPSSIARRVFYRRTIVSILNGVTCPAEGPLSSNEVSVTWIDDYPYLSARSSNRFEGPFQHPWTSGTVSSPNVSGFTLNAQAVHGNSVSSEYRLGAGIVPADGIVSFTYNSSVTSGNADNIRSLLHNFLVGASASGAVNLGVNGNYHIKVKAGDQIAFRISYSNIGLDTPRNTVNVRGVVTNFRYHVNNANDTGIICPGSSYTVIDPVIASSNVPSTWRWAKLSGAGSFSSSSVLTGSGVVPSNPTYNSVGGDAGTNVVLLFEATRTGGACDQRKDSALVIITVRPTLVPPTVVGGQDRIRCYSTAAGTMVATPASGGTGPYEYLWQYRDASSGSWVNIDGSNTLVLNHTRLLTQTTEYRILVTDLGIPSCGTLVPGNGIVTVTVLDALNAPVFAPNVPGYLYRCPGTTLSLSVLAASGGHNVFDYTWQYIDSAAVPAGSTINDPNINTWPWQSIVGSISLSPPGGLSYVVPSLPSGTTRYYRVVARDTTVDTPSDPNCGSAWSRAMKVSYLDVVAPIIRPVRQIRVYLGSNGQATYDCSNAANLDSASTDNCGESVRDFRLTRCTTNLCPVFTCPAGLDTVCFSGSDASGNIGTSTIQVVKLDTIKPVAIAQDTIEVFLNAAGVAVISNAAIANNGSTDNCNVLTYSISPTTYRCSDLFGRAATFTVTDASGNSSSDVLWVKVTDRIAPVSVPKVRVIGLLDSFGLVSNITPGLVDSLSSDNCSVVDRYILNDTFGLYNNNYSCADLDNIRLGYLVVVDTSGNRDTAAFEILIKDFFAPAVLSFPASTIYIRPNDDCQVLFYWQNGLTYADNCGGAVTLTQPVVFHNGASIADSVLNTPIVLLSRGVHYFDFTLTDIRGNSRRYRHTIEVIDTIHPRILNCPVGASLVTSAWECGARYFWTEPSATDNCSGLTMTSTHASGSLFPVGNTVVTYTVVDASGRSTSCSFVVVVADSTPPTVTPRNQNLYLNATGTVTVNSSTLVNASDNCAQSITYNPPTVTFNCSNRGINTRLITVSDGTNQASTNVSVSVFDSIRPVIVVRQNIVVTLNSAGLGVLTVAQVDSNSSDNCAVVVRRLSNTAFSCFDIGIQQVVFTVEDASGNFRDQVVDVLVRDGTPPTVSTVYSSAPNAFVTYLNAAGEVSVNSASLITASDNCGIDSIVPSVLTFNCSNVNLPGQSNIRQVRVRDVNGLSTTINVHVSVRDSIRPVVTSNNRTVILNSSGSTTISAASLVTFSDNCCIGAITAGVPAQANVTFGCTNVGINTVAVTVNDCNGNSSIVNVQVVVADTTSPVLTITNPSPRVVYLDAQCGATLASSQLVSANDACAPVVLTPANHFFNAANCGDTVLVTITARDVNQNSSSIVVPVRVIDTIRPVANFVPQNISVGQCNSVVTFDNPTGFDNCGSVVVTQTSGLASGSSFPVGVTTNVFRLTDNCGNFRDVSFTVTVNAFVLNYNPTNYVVCSLDSSITLSTVSGVTLVGSGVVGNLFYPTRAAIGINVISWSYVDAFGCDTSGTFTVEVLESPALPEIIRVTSTLLRVSQPFNAYQWYRYGGLIPGATSRDYNVTLSGVYTVRVMGPSGCYRMSNPIGMGVGVGIEELNAEGINLYPNPNSGHFTLSIEDYDDKSRDMVVLDMTGRQVFRDEVKMGIQQFNLSHLAQGRYIVRIMGDRGLSMKSLIINY